jgi:DNA processing protein
MLLYQIALSQIKGIGPVLAKNLIAYLGSVEAIFQEKKRNLSRIPDIGPVLSKQITDTKALQRAEKELNFITKNNIQTYFYTEKTYPFRLKECPDSPILLYGKGQLPLNTRRTIGVVGTRDASEYGKELCKHMVADLASLSNEISIISGLAYGIDICSHKAALDADMPTIGIVGHGLDRLYPSAHRNTAVKMLEKGGLLTEYISGTNPDRQNFVQRNRLIAGMCDGIVVVESGEKGGSLITAESAQSYNRDVFAFPGRVGDTLSAGCNMLIKKNKAALIESATDLANAMCWELGEKKIQQPTLFPDLNEIQQIIVGHLRTEGNTAMNMMALKIGLPVSKTSALLLELEFMGVVRCLPGNIYTLNL